MGTEATLSLSAAEAERRYCIRPGVARVQRPSGMVLVEPEQGRSVRVSLAAYELVPLLVEGASFAALAQRLRERHPRAGDVERKLRRFLDQLEHSGLLGEAGQPPKLSKRFVSFNADPAARWLAAQVQRLPAWLGWSLLALLGLAAISRPRAVAAAGRLPHPSLLFSQFSLWGLALFVGVVVVVHEAAHALACRLSGVPVSDAGLLLHNGVVPGPYVNTSQMYQVAERAPRFWVAAAGPLVDALGLGAAAAWLLLADPSHGAAVAAATTLLLLCAAFLFLDTNPLAPSDGSRMLEALLGDELARVSALSRRRALMSTLKTVAWYRIACSMHLQGSAVLFYFWWVLT